MTLQARLLDQTLQDGVEGSAVTHAQQEQHVETRDLAALARLDIHFPGVRAVPLEVIEWLELLVVSREGGCVGLPDGS